MKVARFYAPGDIRIEEAPEPTPGPAEVKIRVRACSTCGTDVKIYHAGHQRIDPPRIMGHEVAGEIVEIGAEVGPAGDGRAWLEHDLSEPDVDRLPIRGWLRRVPHRPSRGAAR